MRDLNKRAVYRMCPAKFGIETFLLEGQIRRNR